MQKQSGRNKIVAHPVHPALLFTGCLLALFSLPVLVRAWDEPTSPPASYTQTKNDLRFLNGSMEVQKKAGSLVIGLAGDNAKLCINSQARESITPLEHDYGANDPANCYSSFQDLINSNTTAPAGTAYLPLGKIVGMGHELYNYPVSTGFIRIKNAILNNQRMAIIAEANPRGNSTAIYAGDSGVSANYAGYFTGQMLIGDGTANSEKELCLNQTTKYNPLLNNTSDPLYGRGCIKSWTNLVYGDIEGAYLPLDPSTPSMGQVAVNGSILWGGLSSGALPSNVDMKFTCGDGRCTSSTNPPEIASTCPVDCEQLYPPAEFISGPGRGKALFSTKTASTPGYYYMLVLRKTGGYPTAVPVNGAFYTTGQTIGDSVVAYATPAPLPYWSGGYVGGIYSNYPFMTVDQNLTNGTEYFYRAYSANIFPRYITYGQSLTTSVTPQNVDFALTIKVNGSSMVKVQPQVSDTPAIFCNKSGPIKCTDQTYRILPGTRVAIIPWQGSVNTYGLNPDLPGGCAITTDNSGRITCTLIMPGNNLTVTVNSTDYSGGAVGGGGSSGGGLYGQGGRSP